jgi:hypothetical protein
MFEGLLENESLRVFDLSWNSIGRGTPSCAPSLAEVLIVNEKLVHVDLANCDFTFEES